MAALVVVVYRLRAVAATFRAANAWPPEMFLSSSVYKWQICFHWLAVTALHSGFCTSAVACTNQPCVVAR